MAARKVRRAAPKRKALSKKARFEVFKRDEFSCQYCGRRPPEIVLEVDHIVAVANGGGDDDHNLLTACFDCNRGKRDGTLEALPIDVPARAAMLKERMDQAHAYEDLLQERRTLEEWAVSDVVAAYERAFPGWTVADRVRPSIRNFLRRLPKAEVIDAMELACARMNSDKAFRYFCGVCWNRITASEA